MKNKKLKNITKMNPNPNPKTQQLPQEIQYRYTWCPKREPSIQNNNKGNYKQGEKTAFRMGENNSK